MEYGTAATMMHGPRMDWDRRAQLPRPHLGRLPLQHAGGVGQLSLPAASGGKHAVNQALHAALRALQLSRLALHNSKVDPMRMVGAEVGVDRPISRPGTSPTAHSNQGLPSRPGSSLLPAPTGIPISSRVRF